MPKTTPRPTPENPVGADDGEKKAGVLCSLPADAMATAASTRKMSTSRASNVRSRLTEALMLRADSPNTMAMAATLKIHQAMSVSKVAST